MTVERRNHASGREDRIVQFVNQFFIRLAAIAVACLLAVYGHLASSPDAAPRPDAPATRSSESETAR